MRNITFITIIISLFLSCTQDIQEASVSMNFIPKDTLSTDTIKSEIQLPEKKYRSIHIFVALCDNIHQGILPVPKKIGNGKDPRNNLYWGCGYGVKTYFKRSSEWILLKSIPPKEDYILERLLFKHKDSAVYLLADAIDGEQIKQANINMLKSLAGDNLDTLYYDKQCLQFGGQSNLIAYAGHDYIMDYDMNITLEPKDSVKREAIILACISSEYYAPYVKKTGAYPLLWTTQLMAPEAYSLEAAIKGWVLHESHEAIEIRAAKSYSDHHPSCSLKAAMNLFKTGW